MTKEYDVIIIGSGPAGNTAGIYLVRSGYKVAMITGMEIGGQLTITTDIENFPAFPSPIKGSKLMELMIEQTQNLGVEIIYDVVNKVDFSKRPFICKTENGNELISNNIVISTGASAKYLGLPSEKEYFGYGVSACATCDGNFFKNKKVAIIGGGDTAGTEALHLSKLASEVSIIYRKSNFFRMEQTTINKINNCANINCIFDSEVIEIIGQNEPKKVTGVEILNNKTNIKSKIDLDGVFIAIGRSPNTKIFENTKLELDKDNYIITKPDSTKTNIEGVYACGDVVNKNFKQAVVAAGYGCIAALEIEDDK